MGDRGRRSDLSRNRYTQASSQIGAWSLSGLIFGMSLLLNFAWEMTQMFSYAGMSRISWRSLLTCFGAALADAAYCTCVYWAGSAFCRTPSWIFKLTGRSVFVLFVSGLLTGAFIERLAVIEGFWRYRDTMPLLPFGIGLWPVLQLMVLPATTLWIVAKMRRGPERNRNGRQTRTG